MWHKQWWDSLCLHLAPPLQILYRHNDWSPSTQRMTGCGRRASWAGDCATLLDSNAWFGSLKKVTEKKWKKFSLPIGTFEAVDFSSYSCGNFFSVLIFSSRLAGVSCQLPAFSVFPCLSWAENLSERDFCGTLFDFQSQRRKLSLPIHPSRSPHDLRRVFCTFSLVCLLGGLEQWVRSWIFRAGQQAHVSGAHTHTHASRVAASKPVPENGLPRCRYNTNLLKYLNIRSLQRLPCNYTCSYHILI